VRVLGVDPGLTRCGVGVVEGDLGRRLTMVEVTVVRSDSRTPTPERLLALDLALTGLVSRHRPDAIAVERVFADVNVLSVMGTAQASAVAMLVAARHGIPVHLHTPTEVKASVTGNGRADKAQVTAMVTRLLRLPTAPTPADAADALALAICHLWRGGRHQPDRTGSRCRAGPPRGRCRRVGIGKDQPMIASVRGQVNHVGLDNVVIEVGGVGVLVHVTPATATSLRSGSTAYLATSLVVREDSLTLFGFADADGRSVFETVQTVTGVGPRLALAMLAVHSPDGVRAAVASGDLNALMKVPGIGRKGAERLVLELRDKMGMPSGPVGSPAAAAAAPDWARQVREALVGLGWSAKQAEDTVEAITPEAGERPDVSALLRLALQRLARS
jgi:Holliday junction DNA helicase RuvA